MPPLKGSPVFLAWRGGCGPRWLEIMPRHGRAFGAKTRWWFEQFGSCNVSLFIGVSLQVRLEGSILRIICLDFGLPLKAWRWSMLGKHQITSWYAICSCATSNASRRIRGSSLLCSSFGAVTERFVHLDVSEYPSPCQERSSLILHVYPLTLFLAFLEKDSSCRNLLSSLPTLLSLISFTVLLN